MSAYECWEQDIEQLENQIDFPQVLTAVLTFEESSIRLPGGFEESNLYL